MSYPSAASDTRFDQDCSLAVLMCTQGSCCPSVVFNKAQTGLYVLNHITYASKEKGFTKFVLFTNMHHWQICREGKISFLDVSII